jgi:acyl-CoA synthetase (NDP forming)
VPDITKLLSPKSVAVIGASSDTRGLRGRILEVMLGHPYAGAIYPVSRSAAEVQGRKAYASVADVPMPIDLAVLIIPATFVPEELERCGRAGIKAATILSSGFAEEPGEAGARMQNDIRAIAARYDMAVSGPNNEGFANIPAALCPTFSPAADIKAGALASERPLGRRQVSVISQSGGLGFAFLDRARGRNLLFRYIVTTGNEACLEASDFLDHLIDEGRTDVFLLLLEDVKTPDKFRHAADKALAAGKPLIVATIGDSARGARAVAAHPAANAGSAAEYRAMFEDHGAVVGRDFDEMLDLATGFVACGDKLPAGKRVAIVTSSGGGGVWMADACVRAGLDVPELDRATRAAIDAHLPSYGTSQNPIDTTAQGVHQLGYAAFAQLAAQSPLVDGVILIVTARHANFLIKDQPQLTALGRETEKPVLVWSYTLPAEQSVAILTEAGYPLFTNAETCARTLRALADYRATREALLRTPPAKAAE